MGGFDPLYLSLGVSLLGLSILSMSVIFGNDTRGFINMQIDMAKSHATILLLITFLLYILGTVHYLARSSLTLNFVFLGAVIAWIGFLSMEIGSVIKLYREGFRPKCSKTLLDVIVYMAVFWLILEKIDIHWTLLQVFLTIFIFGTLYFVRMLKKYRKMITVIVEPMDLYIPAVGLRLISAITGLSLISYAYSENVFKGMIALGYLILAVIFWYSAMDMQRIFKLCDEV